MLTGYVVYVELWPGSTQYCYTIVCPERKASAVKFARQWLATRRRKGSKYPTAKVHCEPIMQDK
jgi:hypothetical protein